MQKWTRTLFFVLPGLFSLTNGSGLMLPYRPYDVSNECAFSHTLRFDLSFGMGLSDTITLVLRTLTEIDYKCTLEIVTEDSYVLLLVIKYPTTLGENCLTNMDTITLMRKDVCVRICDIVQKYTHDSYFFATSVSERIRFRFISNSSLINELNSNIYQITATSARKIPPRGCSVLNESKCSMPDSDYCFTNGVVCDGIKNCAAINWFDERRSECGLPVDRLGYKPVIAVFAAVICALLAAGHLLLRCLPPLAQSFFIFKTNEDNRLCLDPIFQPPDSRTSNSGFDEVKVKKASIIPVPSYSSDNSSSSQGNYHSESEHFEEEVKNMSLALPAEDNANIEHTEHRRTIVRSMTAQLQEKLRFITGRKKSKPLSDVTEV